VPREYVSGKAVPVAATPDRKAAETGSRLAMYSGMLLQSGKEQRKYAAAGGEIKGRSLILGGYG
jgi:hypothetical protein